VTTKRDYYEILGVSPTASAEELKSAYRKAAMRWHPDRNPEDKHISEEKFREASEAYSVLSDPQKRQVYDHYGHEGLSGMGAGPIINEAIFEEFSDIFGDLFGFGDIFGTGRGRRRTRAQRGHDLRYDLNLTFEEAAQGSTTKLKVPRLELCSACNGTGAEHGTSPSRCQKCGGHGQILYQQGFLSVTRTCRVCHGSGQVVLSPCHECRGEGRVEKSKTIEVRIPPGVDDQTRLRIPGEGEAGVYGGPPGDLYVVLRVKEHPFFERRNADLYCVVPINFSQAALGAELHIPTMNGKEKLTIPAGTQSGSVLRLKGKGLPNPNGGPKGDLFVEVRVATPQKLTREQKILFEELANTLATENEPAPRDSGFFQKVKDIFS